MEEASEEILGIEFVDKRQTNLKSPNMEPLGLRNVLGQLKDAGLTITEVVTDAHSQIPPVLRM